MAAAKKQVKPLIGRSNNVDVDALYDIIDRLLLRIQELEAQLEQV